MLFFEFTLNHFLILHSYPDQAFLVADGFIVSFDGHVLKIPHSCDLVLAADVTKNTFAITLKYDWTEKQHSLVVQMQNTTVMVRPKEQVCSQLTAVFMSIELALLLLLLCQQNEHILHWNRRESFLGCELFGAFV